MLKQFLGGVDDRVRLFALEPFAIVDAPPGDGDRVHARGLGGADVERRVAHVRGVVGTCVHTLRREQQRFGIGLVLLGLVPADNGLEEVRDWHARKRELDGRAALGRYDAQTVTLLVQPQEDFLHANACLELVVERLVVGAVDADEVVDPLGREDLHLRFEPGTADGLHQLGVPEVAAEHLARRVPHGREDDPAGIDDGAIEIEEDDRETDHGGHRNDGLRAASSFYLQPGKRNEPTRVAQDPMATVSVVRYSCVYQNVQSSVGSTLSSL
jgi:hypothetical protein